jgi:transposase-like protein
MDIESQILERRIYSIDLRHQICKEHITEGVKLADLVRKYQLSSHSLIHEWLRRLGYLPCINRRTQIAYIGVENLSVLKNNLNKNKTATKEEQQIAQLKKELGEAKLLAEGYRRIIEIAEEELKIPIRKKHNTK